MAEIRGKVKAEVEGSRDRRPAFTTYSAQSDGNGAARKAGEIVNSEELRFLNLNYAYGRLNLDNIRSHRPGFIGKLIVKCKRKLFSIIWDSLLKDYFAAERDFQSNLVRLLNNFTKYVDSRDASNFWELIRKIDYDVTKALDRIERINDEQGASMRSSERRMFDTLESSLGELNKQIGKLLTSEAVHAEKLKTLDGVSKGLEHLVGRMQPGAVPAASGVTASTPVRAEGDYSYLVFENRFRGSEDEIAKRMQIYVDLYRGSKDKVMEIGPGRGELQSLLKANSIPSYAIDIDAAMVEACNQKGIECYLGDPLAHLRGLPDGKLGGVIAIQVVEHLSSADLQELINLAAQKVMRGGKIIFETINPQSVLALSSNYFRDPSHVFPQHPDTLAYRMEMAGLKVNEIRMLSPVPQEAQLRQIPVEEHMTPRWAFTVDSLNWNISKLNDLLFGYQDFCIVAEVK